MTGVIGVIYTNFKVTPCNEKCNFFHIFCLKCDLNQQLQKTIKLMTIQKFITHNEISNYPKNTPLFAINSRFKENGKQKHKITLFGIFIKSDYTCYKPCL